MFFKITNNIIKITERTPALVPENIRLQINNIEDIDKDEFRLKIRIKKIELSITLYPLAINPE
jgi:NAD(P)H-flavin reductase